jgi:mycothiol synthase
MVIGDLNLSISEYRAKDLSDDELAPIAEFTNVLGAERAPRHIALTLAELRMMSDFPGYLRKRMVVRSPSAGVVALSNMQVTDDGTNSHLLRLTVMVAGEHRRLGIGTEMVRIAAEHAREQNRHTISGDVHSTVPAGGRFANALGAHSTMEFNENVVSIDALDRELLNTWTESGQQRAIGYSVSIFEGPYPDEILDGMAHLYHVLERDQPAPEGWEPAVWTGERVNKFIAHFLEQADALTAIAFDRAGTPAGMSQLIRRKSSPETWLVTTTMVDPSHRGMALGKWVKGAVNLAAMELWDGGEFQETGNADSNEAMLGINRAMGFRQELVITNFEVDLATLDSYLHSRT